MRSAFIKKKEEQSDKVLIEAQRLVNLYRNINAFPEEFHAELDQTLLHTSSEVQSTLTRIVGGEEVRRYLDFLKENKTYSVENEAKGIDNPINKAIYKLFKACPVGGLYRHYHLR